MSKKKNGFREWLSDNLRYIILGFAMLVILALLYIGFCLLVSLVAGTQLKDGQSVQIEQEFDVSGEDMDQENTEENNSEESSSEAGSEETLGSNTQEE